MKNRIYPVVPSKPDERDFKYSKVTLPGGRTLKDRFKAMFVPESVDLEQYCGPVKNQGQLGCCTGFTYSGYRELMLRKYFNYELSSPDAVLSPIYVYYRERQLENSIYQDGGADMRTGCRVLTQWGVCTEGQEPYNIDKFTKAPEADDDVEAAKLKMSEYHRLYTIEDWRDCLRKGHPIAIGMMVYPAFEEIDAGGRMHMPSLREQELGGHAVLVIGFDDKTKYFKVRNSWGADWGNHGNFYMPYDFAASPNYVFDAWMLTLATEENNGQQQ